jgi:hypothetical protein
VDNPINNGAKSHHAGCIECIALNAQCFCGIKEKELEQRHDRPTKQGIYTSPGDEVSISKTKIGKLWGVLLTADWERSHSYPVFAV